MKPKPNEVGQQLDNSDLTQQTEEFEPLQTGQEVDNSDLFPYQTGNLQVTQNDHSGFGGIPSQGLDNSRKPQQELYPPHSQPTHYQQVSFLYFVDSNCFVTLMFFLFLLLFDSELLPHMKCLMLYVTVFYRMA